MVKDGATKSCLNGMLSNKISQTYDKICVDIII